MPSANGVRTIQSACKKFGKFSTKGLHPDLLPYLKKDPLLGIVLDHPLMRYENLKSSGCDVSDTGSILGLNAALQQKELALQAASDRSDFRLVVFLHQRPYRVDALIDIIDRLPAMSRKAWKLVRDVWEDSENIRHYIYDWREIWTGENGSHLAMNARERAKLKRLPDEFRVWRGVSHPDAVAGLSWTLDQSKADWFANRWASDSSPRIVATGMVRKSDVIAFLNDRKELEIVVLPERVIDIDLT